MEVSHNILKGKNESNTLFRNKTYFLTCHFFPVLTSSYSLRKWKRWTNMAIKSNSVMHIHTTVTMLMFRSSHSEEFLLRWSYTERFVMIRFAWLLFGFSMIRLIWKCKLRNRNNFLYQNLYDAFFRRWDEFYRAVHMEVSWPG